MIMYCPDGMFAAGTVHVSVPVLLVDPGRPNSVPVHGWLAASNDLPATPLATCLNRTITEPYVCMHDTLTSMSSVLIDPGHSFYLCALLLSVIHAYMDMASKSATRIQARRRYFP